MKFSYRRYEVEPSPTVPDGVLYRPMVHLRVIGRTTEHYSWALVDPGADETLLPLSIARIVGAALDETVQWPVGGIGGHEVRAILGEVELAVAHGRHAFRWPQYVGFVAFAPDDEIAILGHAGFLNFFVATFDGVNKHLKLRRAAELPRKRQKE